MERELASFRLEAIVDRVHPLAVLGDPVGIKIEDVVFDHRRVKPGSLFCCLPGEHRDGHDFAGLARQAGATSFICEHSLGRQAAGAVQLVVAPGSAREAMARAACAFYRDPSTALHLAGITGTNGKTTTAYLLRSILEKHGWKTGVVGPLDGARTTPEAPDLQRALARYRDAGCVAGAVEVTSHALAQYRVDGMVFDVAVFTNLSQDHLDYHKTMEAYFSAKAELFTPERAQVAVVNRDDPYGRRLLERPLIPMVAFSLSDVNGLEVDITGSRFELGDRLVRLRLGAEINVRNALAAAGAARVLGVGDDAIVAGLEAAEGVAGRLEPILASDGLVVLIDYAHTPAGLEEILTAARRSRPGDGAGAGRVIVVFGCGGDRDRGKRPAMGAIAGRHADLVVLTSDNPRSEDPMSIIAAVRAGMAPSDSCVVEVDRRRAIQKALSEARPNDIVIIAGKGHETTQQVGDITREFDDRAVARSELIRLGRAAIAPVRRELR